MCVLIILYRHVENFTTHLKDVDGHHYRVTATWNNPDGIDELKFSSLYRSALSSLRTD